MSVYRGYRGTFYSPRPLFHHCSFCDVKFDLIGTLEEFDLDVQYIGKKMNITELLDHKDRRMNETPKFGSKGSKKIFSYFSLLEKNVKLRLYNLYKIDFEMFGYSASRYL